MKLVEVIGVPHQLQGPKFNGHVQDPSYVGWIEAFLRNEGVDFVFEEASGRGPSIAQNLADSILQATILTSTRPALNDISTA